MKTIKSLLLCAIIALTTIPVMGVENKTTSSLPKRAVTGTIRLGKVAGYAGLTGFCGLVTGLFAVDALKGALGLKYAISRDIDTLATDSFAQFRSLNMAKTEFKDASFAMLARYATLYFAKKTKEAYSKTA